MDEFKSIVLHLEGGGRPLNPDEVDGMVDKMERMLSIVLTGVEEVEHLKQRLGDMELQRKKVYRAIRHKLFYNEDSKRLKIDSVEMSRAKHGGQYFVKGLREGRQVGSYLLQVDKAVVKKVGDLYEIGFHASDGIKGTDDPWLTIQVNPTERVQLETSDPWFKRETHYPVFEDGKRVVGNSHNRKCAHCLRKLTSVNSCDECKQLKKGVRA